MKIEIRGPSYFKQHYIIDSEITGMCNDIANFIEDKQYSEVVKTIDIVPVVAPYEKLAQGLWAEEVMWTKSIGRASVFKHIDYNKYMTGDVETRKKLTIDCVLKAIAMIKKKSGTKFNAKQFGADLLGFVGYNKEELENI